MNNVLIFSWKLNVIGSSEKQKNQAEKSNLIAPAVKKFTPDAYP